jgi:DNA-binding transcriptional regulator YdaS (Cro superfamily)
MVDAIVRAETLDPDIDPDAFLRGLRVMQNKLEERVQDARGEAGLEIFD